MSLERILVVYNEPVLPETHPDYISEVEVLDNVEAVLEVIGEAGYVAGRLGITSDPLALIEGVRAYRPDAIVNLFEGTADNEGRRPVLLLDESHDLRPDVLGMLRILTNFDMDSRLVLSLVLAGQTPLRTLLARDEQEAMARRIVHYAQLRLLSRDELAIYVAHRCAVAGAATVPFDDRTLDALFEIGRGNLRATDDLALKSLTYAAAAGHATVSVQHVVGARKDLWP